MAVTWVLGENPIWYFVDLTGKPLAGGKFYTFSQLNYPQPKFVFSDPNGNFPYPDPVTIDMNGTSGPFFFAVDSLNPADTYFLFVTDSTGNEIWTVENYSPGGGGGGGGTTAFNLNNLITNGVFYRHTGSLPVAPATSVPVFSTIAPSNNTGLVASTVTSQNPAPDIVFLKNNTSATDAISFPQFVLGSQPIIGLGAPVDYFNYSCTVPGSAETQKCLQFPITSKVQNLSNESVCGTLWAMANGGTSTTITLQWLQYFGDGAGASTPAVSAPFATFTLTGGGTWELLNFSTVVPDVSGNNLGGPLFGGPAHNMPEGPNDGLFLQVVFPQNATCNIGFTNLTLYEGSVFSDTVFQTYDQIDAVISSPRTGDIRVSMNSFTPFGWVLCNDGVLANGNPAIVLPAGLASARSDADTYPLYSLIWNATAGNPGYAPIYDSAGAVTTRGASAIADFSASKQLALTRALGRALSSAGQASNIDGTTGVVTPFGTAWNLGQSNVGEQTHTMTGSELVSHTHGIPLFTTNGGAATSNVAVGSLVSTATTATTNPTGSTTPFNVMQPTSFWNVFLKL